MGPKHITYDHLMKIEWLTADVAAVRSPIRAESDVFEPKLRFEEENHVCEKSAGLIKFV